MRPIVITIPLDRRLARLTLALALVAGLSYELASEMLTITTTYPSPVGVYNQLITTGGTGAATTLNRSGGNTILVPADTNPGGRVGIGTAAPDAAQRLDVAGNARVSGQLTVTGTVFAGAVLNPTYAP